MSQNLAETRLYQNHGVDGLRWFARTWFPFVYAVLLGLAATIVWLSLSVPAAIYATIAVVACVLAIGLTVVTRMLRQFRAGIHAIESRVID